MSRRSNQGSRRSSQAPRDEWEPEVLERVLEDPERISTFDWRSLPGLILHAPPNETPREAQYRSQDNQRIYDLAVDRWNARMRNGGMTPPPPNAPPVPADATAQTRQPIRVPPVLVDATALAGAANSASAKRPREEISLNDDEVGLSLTSLHLIADILFFSPLCNPVLRVPERVILEVPVAR
jgi:hypothetical protein